MTNEDDTEWEYENTPETVEDLLDHVEDTDGDFHDGIGGYLLYSISDDVLTVTFENSETDETLKGRWQLTRLG